MEINEKIDLKRLFDIFKSKKLLVCFTLIVFVILGYLYSYKYVTPQYKSTSSLLLIPNTTSETITNSDLTVNSGLITTYSSIAKNSKVLKKVISNLKLSITEEELLSKLSVNVKKNTYIIEITVTDSNPKMAMNITKELSKVFLNEIQAIYNLNNIGIIDEAQLANKPYNIHHKKDLVIFFCIGIVVSSILIIFIYLFNSKIEKEEEIEKYLSIKSLGIVPLNISKKSKDEIIEKNDTKSFVAECINAIRTNILYMNSTNNAKTILITSSTPDEGKSWISSNIATSFAEINKKVLLIDADMRKGRLHKIFDVPNKEGLSEYLYSMTGDVKDDITLGNRFIQETKIPNLHILTNGHLPQNPSELLASTYMKELIALFKTTYDIVIVDAPPCRIVTDSVILSTIVDSTVLVVNSSKTSINELKEVKKSIDLVDGQIIGAILNKVKIAGRAYKNNYYYESSEKLAQYNTSIKGTAKVNELINDALTKLAENNYDLYPEEKDSLLIKEDLNESNMDYWIKQQNQYLEKLMAYISDMKVQFNYSTAQNQRDNKQKLESIHKKLEDLYETSQHDNFSHTTNLNKISQDLDTFKTTYKEISNELESIHTSVNIGSKQINSNNFKFWANVQKDIDSNTKEIANNRNLLENNNNFINSKTQEIINSNNTILENLEHNINSTSQQNLHNTNESLKKIESAISENIKQAIFDNSKNFLDSVQEDREIMLALSQRLTKFEQSTQNLLIEQISNINYAEKINNLNNMITDLKDNYSKLYNLVESINNENKKLKSIPLIANSTFEKTYNINYETIPYHELEELALTILPLKNRNIKTFTPEDYRNVGY